MDFYSESDTDRRGNISSEYPAWYHARHIEDLQEQADSIEKNLRLGAIPSDKIHAQKILQANIKNKLDAIMKNKPSLSDTEKDKLNKIYKSISEKIECSMFTKSEMMLGLADAHTEAERMMKPCINLSPEEASIAKSCNVKMGQDRKVSRNAAAKIFKLVGKLLGEPTNIEYLRRDGTIEGHKTRH